MKKINCVLLIDDDEATNYIHNYVLTQTNFAVHVKTVENGQEAMDYLTAPSDSAYIKPDMILLDINMPVMNGWEFLEHYMQLDDKLKGDAIVVMVSTSLNPDDKENATLHEIIDHYISKPLTIEVLKDLQLKFFTKKS